MFTTWFVENLSSIKQQIIMVTLNFKILPNRRKASNKLGIYLAVSHKKETRYITTAAFPYGRKSRNKCDDVALIHYNYVCNSQRYAMLNNIFSIICIIKTFI